MAELARFYAIYFRDFGQPRTPHVHVSYGGEEAVLAISDGRTLAGKAPRLAMRLAREYLAAYRTEVAAAWAAAKAGRGVGKIGAAPEFGRKRRSTRHP